MRPRWKPAVYINPMMLLSLLCTHSIANTAIPTITPMPIIFLRVSLVAMSTASVTHGNRIESSAAPLRLRRSP